MKIHAHIVAWNEEKILPFTLDHYSQFCDKIIVYDNMSDDNSHDIYKKYDNVSVRKWESSSKRYNDVSLAEIKSTGYKRSRDDNADWVIVCDCDEFLYHNNLLDILNEYTDKGITMPKIDGHDMCSVTFPEYDGELLTDKVKIGSKTYNVMCKNIIFNPILDVRYHPGAHANQSPGAIYSDIPELKLLHYKFLGKDYVVERYNTLANRRSDFNVKNRLSEHWTRPPLKYMDSMLKERYRVI